MPGELILFDGLVDTGTIVPRDVVGEEAVFESTVGAGVDVVKADDVSEGMALFEDVPEDETALGSLYARTTTSALEIVLELRLEVEMTNFVLEIELTSMLDVELDVELDTRLLKPVLEVDRLVELVLKNGLGFALELRLVRLLGPVLGIRLDPEFEVELLAFAFDVELPASVVDVGPWPVLTVELWRPVVEDAVPGLILGMELRESVLVAE